MLNLFTALMAGAAFVAAVEVSANDNADCADWGELAQVVMEARQERVPMSDVMDAVGEGVDEMVIMAYDHPAYSTREYQLKAEQEFANEIMKMCYRARR